MEYNEEIIVAPLESRDIWIFSTKTRQWRSIPLNKYDYCTNKTYFRNMFMCGDVIVFAGGYYPALVTLKPEKNKIEYITNIFSDRLDLPTDLFFRSRPIEIDNTLYFASCKDNSILKLNKSDFDYEWIPVGKEGNRYSGIAYDGHCFLLSPRKNTSIVKWDGYKCSELEIPSYINRLNDTYSGIVETQEGFLTIAVPGNHFGSIILDKNEQIHITNNKYTMYKRFDSGAYIFQTDDGKVTYCDSYKQMYKFDLNMDKDHFYRLWIESELDRKELTSEVFNEGESISFQTWIKLI
ncbi:MAG: hypothetical protein K5662_07680 [Lachnospiraceae bacterium]|nr:hypothetical protein [Lachnospiraceae bacterium]